MNRSLKDTISAQTIVPRFDKEKHESIKYQIQSIIQLSKVNKVSPILIQSLMLKLKVKEKMTF